jgi:SAM-dependent methyltransferase
VELDVTALEARVEERHWWFVGRRRLFARVIGRSLSAPRPRVLDVGTSTGTNLRMCRALGFDHVTGVDVSEAALAYAVGKGLGPVSRADVRALPARANSFDLVLATDVIEHVDDDRAAVQELARVVGEHGVVLITVPAFQVLWSRHDEVTHHKRRYRKSAVIDLIAASGLELEECYYFNFLLFIPILAVRKLLALFRVKHRGDTALNIGFVNPILLWVFRRDVDLAPRIRPPFGVSLLALARKGSAG